MILGLPTESDLKAAGVDYLYMASAEAIAIVHEETVYEEYAEDRVDEEAAAGLIREYWTSVRRKLAKCASLLQMGTELLLKAHIARVSPHALLDSVGSWPKSASKADTYFDEFRTIDAQALTQVVNTLCDQRLSEEFMTTFDSVRRRRNAVVHAASDRAVPTCEAVIRDVLIVSANLIGEGQWPGLHRAQAHSPPFSRIDVYSYIEGGLLRDFEFMLNLLKPREAERHLGLSKRRRRYYCPSCRLGKFAPDIKLAVLDPNASSSCQVSCIACGGCYEVTRRSCDTCAGNVIDEEGCCLSCSGYPADG